MSSWYSSGITLLFGVFVDITIDDIEVNIVRYRESFTVEGKQCFKYDLQIELKDFHLFASMVPDSVSFAAAISSLPADKGYELVLIGDVLDIDLRDCYRLNVKDRYVRRSSFTAIASAIQGLAQNVIGGMV